MDLKQLYYFVTVVKEGNISKAAKKLHLSQPPLSTQLKNLEAELGCSLFERGARKIELSEAGRLLYPRAVSLLELSEITKIELTKLQSKAYGTLRLGVVSSIASTFLNEKILSFHKLYPDINFELFEGNTYEQLELLKNNETELALVRTPFENKSFTSISLKTEPMMAIGHAKYFLDMEKDAISLAELTNKPLIIYRRWEDLLLRIFAEEAIPYQIFCKNDDAKTTLHWADSGLGVGIVPYSTLGLAQNKDTVCKKIADTRLNSHICLVYKENHYFSSIAQLFLEHFIKD